MQRTQAPIVDVPRNYPTATIFIDEAGSRASSDRLFVVGAVKTRNPGRMARALRVARDRTGYDGEFKFADVTRGSYPAYCLAIDTVLESDVHFAACVVRRDTYDPFRGHEQWEVHRDVIGQLLRGCINRRELVAVLMDGISTPTEVALDDAIRDRVNTGFGSTSVVSAVCVDSRCNDGVQMADLFAGAVLFDRRRRAGSHGSARPSTSSYKAKLATRLLNGLGVTSFDDVRHSKLNVATYRARSARKTGNNVVSFDKKSSATG